MPRHRIRKRPCAVPLLLTLLSLGEAKIPQHRVKSGTRVVGYRESSRAEPFSKFWIPDSSESHRDSRTEFHGRGTLQAPPGESSLWWSEDESWHLHVDASGRANQRRRRLIDSLIYETPEDELVEEDPNQESISGVDDQNVTYNVTTEVEYGEPLNNTNSTSNSSSSSVVYTTSESEGNATSTDPVQPIRIRAILADNEIDSGYLNETQRSILFQNILSPAILAWSAALRINRVEGNLTVDPSQLSDGVSCGPGLESGHPSVVVPPEHMTTGIADTDIVVYLSLSIQDEKTEDDTANFPTSAPTRDKRDRRRVQSRLNPDKIGLNPGSVFGSLYNRTHETINYNRDEEDLYCSGDFVAAATYCSTDQHDRPTAALLHLCIGSGFFNETNLKRNIVTVMHELGHALGFNPQSMAHFRDPNGEPITKRDEDGNVVDQVVECSGPQETRRFANVSLPSEDIIQFKSVRGGVRVAAVVTPSVLQVVRNHFDCQNLTGAELESGNVAPLADEETEASCIGDHWERRLFRTDLMNGIVDEVPFSLRISPITLALFADSGWYQVDLSRTAFADGWGRSAGCAFVNEECISEDGHIPKSNEPFFCNEVADTFRRGSRAQIQGCSPDMSRKAVCSMAQYDSELPSVYQYFNGTFGADVGGNEPLLDYCPVFTGFSNGECTEERNSRLLSVSSIEEFGSKNSRCLSGRISGQGTGLCLPIACVIEDRSLRIQIDGTWETCKRSGQVFKTNDRLGTRVHCPDVIRTCPTFYCDRDCLGTGGVCIYDTGECLCPTPTGNTTIYGNCSELGQGLNGIFYEDPLLHDTNGTKPHLEEDSPLADYYVPNERVLKNRRRGQILLPYLASAAALFLLGALFSAGFFQYRRNDDFRDRVDRARERLSELCPGFLSRQGGGDENNNDQPPPVSFRVNKDKFVASMLVDIRVHHPQISENESIPDTTAETDSNGNLTRSELDEDMSSIASESVGATEEQPELPYQIRRRFIRELV